VQYYGNFIRYKKKRTKNIINILLKSEILFGYIHLKKSKISKKLQKLWIEPFQITEIILNNNTKIQKIIERK
jgi:hypothetical protein